MTDHELLRGYQLDQERRGLSLGTIRRRRSLLRSLAHHLPGDLLSASRDDIEAWLATRKLTSRGRYCYLSNIHSFYEWACREELTDSDPTRRIPRPRLARLVPRPISDDDLAYALHAADDRMRAWLALAAFQGLRCKEIAGLEATDVLPSHDPPILVVTGKGKHERILPLNPRALTALRRFGLPRFGPVFLRQDHPEWGVGVAAYTVSHNMAVFLHNLGINATAHQLRHWFGTKLYAHTKDLRAVQEMMGHAHPNTTAAYVAFASRAAAVAVMALAVEEHVVAPMQLAFGVT